MNTTIEQLLAMHEQHYTVTKQALLALQKDATPEPEAPAEPEPFQLVGTLGEMGHEVMYRALKEEINGFKVLGCATSKVGEYVSVWQNAVKEHTFTDAPALWAHLLSHFRDCWSGADGTRHTYIGHIKGVTGRLGIPEDEEFQMFYQKLQLQHKAKVCYTAMPIEEAKSKFLLNDGRVLTTKLLELLLDDESFCADNAEARMLLCMSTYHGNRSQDWTAFKTANLVTGLDRLAAVAYGKSNGTADEDGNVSHYDPESKTMHLYKWGKRKMHFPVRIFKVHDKVAQAISTYHGGANHKYLVPNTKGNASTTTYFQKTIQDTFFKNEKSVLFIKPTKMGTKNSYISPNDLRHLFETHIRYVTKVPQEERLAIMHSVAHDDKTGQSSYGQTYRPMVEWAEQQ